MHEYRLPDWVPLTIVAMGVVFALTIVFVSRPVTVNPDYCPTSTIFGTFQRMEPEPVTVPEATTTLVVHPGERSSP